jgi:TATA-binding protein-associated factor Taf7
MTKDDIARMARESGGLPDPMVFIAAYKRFANLVAKHEREACEMAVEDIARKYQQAHEVSAENVADACAYAIRARGNT